MAWQKREARLRASALPFKRKPRSWQLPARTAAADSSKLGSRTTRLGRSFSDLAGMAPSLQAKV